LTKKRLKYLKKVSFHSSNHLIQTKKLEQNMNLPANWKPVVGWICLILSLCCTTVFWTLPFSGLSATVIGTGVLAAMLTGKTLFGISIYLLGKKYIDQLKARFLGRKKKEETPPSEDNDN
jgi:hypothetical protein